MRSGVAAAWRWRSVPSSWCSSWAPLPGAWRSSAVTTATAARLPPVTRSTCPRQITASNSVTITVIHSSAFLQLRTQRVASAATGPRAARIRESALLSGVSGSGGSPAHLSARPRRTRGGRRMDEGHATDGIRASPASRLVRTLRRSVPHPNAATSWYPPAFLFPVSTDTVLGSQEQGLGVWA